MGTNFYARIIPSKERREQLKKLLDSSDFTAIHDEINLRYGSFRAYNDTDELCGEIHLGKRSAGWKFLWNPQIHIIRHGHLEPVGRDGHTFSRYISDPPTAYYVYPLTKQGIKEFLDRPDVEVYDEYGEKQDKDEFFDMAVNWTTWTNHRTGKTGEAWDSQTYKNEHPEDYCGRCDNELIQYLENNKVKFISYDRSDFYSDGLRFATSIEFS
jgi:hypothetical protein